MARTCDLCGRSPLVGFNVSHAHNKTKKVQRPNLRVVKLAHSGNNKMTIRVCADDLKTLKAKGLISRWKDMPENQKAEVSHEAPKSVKPRKMTPKMKKEKAAKRSAIPAA